VSSFQIIMLSALVAVAAMIIVLFIAGVIG
jgi:hypothetical protein